MVLNMVCWRCSNKLKKLDTERIALQIHVQQDASNSRMQTIEVSRFPRKQSLQRLGSTNTHGCAGSSRVEERISTG